MDFSSLKGLEEKELYKEFLKYKHAFLVISEQMTEEETKAFYEVCNDYHKRRKYAVQNNTPFDTETEIAELRKHYTKLAVALADFMVFCVNEFATQQDKAYALLTGIITIDILRETLLRLPEWIAFSRLFKEFIMGLPQEQEDAIIKQYKEGVVEE
jgi:hypothetical protein